MIKLAQILAIMLVTIAPASAYADPLCLGQIIVISGGEYVPQQDPNWEGHDWFYTTIEGSEIGACMLCEGEWQLVPMWVAGLEDICPQDSWREVSSVTYPLLSLLITVITQDTSYLMQPVYNWDDCRHLILRCSRVVGC